MMNYKQKGILTLLALITFAISIPSYYTQSVLAAETSVHVRIVGATQTVWYGDVTIDGCSVTDTDGIAHVYTQQLAVCALDAAADAGGFTYAVKDFGGSLGLFLQSVSGDTGATDFSTYWSYDLNGASASQGISSQIVNSGDSLYFHFEDPSANPNTRAINDGITYLRSQQQSNGQISGFTGVSGWAAITFASAGVDPATVTNGGPSLLDYLSANPPTTSSSATEWERGVLAITASGGNPYSFGGVNYVQQLEAYHNNAQIGSTTFINDDIFGLLALISAGSGASSQIKQDALIFILSHQGSDGGFSWSTTGSSDVDDTAAAVQALVAAQNAGMTAPNLATSLTNARNYILAAKNSDGGFASVAGDASNTSTTSWAVMALNALGVTGADVTNANAYMRGNQEENGSFKWQSASTGETFTSSYAVLALTGKYWPVKIFAGVSPMPTNAPTSNPTATPSPSPTVVPSPTVTVTPTSTPVPSVTVSPSPSPAVSGTSKLSDRWQRVVRHEQKRLHKMHKKQGRALKQIQAHIHEVVSRCSQFVTRGMHR